MKKITKIVLGVTASACTVFMVCLEGITLAKYLKYDGLSKKMEGLASEKNISLEEKNYFSPFYEDSTFTADNDLAKRIQKELLGYGWKLEKSDSIEVGEHSILYKGNVEGSYTLDGKTVDSYCLASDYSTLSKDKLILNEDGTRVRDYTPKTPQELEQVRLTVLEAIDNVLKGKTAPYGGWNNTLHAEDNAKSRYTDIQIVITSEPDFDQFIPCDYRFYKSVTKKEEGNLVNYALLVVMYILTLAVFCNTGSERNIKVTVALETAALVTVMIYCTFNMLVPIVVLATAMLCHYGLSALTKNRYPRFLMFIITGLMTGVFVNSVRCRTPLQRALVLGENCLSDVSGYVLMLSNIFMCIVLSLAWQVIIDNRNKLTPDA